MRRGIILHVKHWDAKRGFEIRGAVAGVATLGALAGAAVILALLWAPRATNYTNYPYRFAVALPAGLKAVAMPYQDGDPGTQTYLFEDQAGEGVQLMIWPYTDAPNISPSDIEQTGLTISDVTPLSFAGAPGYEASGYTFRSNNPAFDGASSDAWFVYRGSLYQLSTYARDDALLKRLLASWTFF